MAERCIAVVTGSRADWGLLLPVVKALHQHPALSYRLWVTGSHIEDRFGHTAKQIEKDGFNIDATVPLKLGTSNPHDTSKALAKSIEGFAGLLHHQAPDMMLVLGDRYEIFGAVQAAALAAVPVAHIAGGDVSEGAYDDGMRHAISKLSQLHFPTNAEARQRLLQMGEPNDRIHLCGSPGIDNILTTPRLSREQFTQQFGYHFQARNLLVSFHPATLADQSISDQIDHLLAAIQALPDDIGVLLSGSNADHGGDEVNRALKVLSDSRPHTHYVSSFGNQGYYSALAEVDLLVGNSSSGLYEAPSLQTPTLDIGQRQQGRLRGPSVSHCDNNSSAIISNITQLLTHPPSDFHNPYGKGGAATCIAQALAQISDFNALKRKTFVMVNAPCTAI